MLGTVVALARGTRTYCMDGDPETGPASTSHLGGRRSIPAVAARLGDCPGAVDDLLEGVHVRSTDAGEAPDEDPRRTEIEIGDDNGEAEFAAVTVRNRAG
ncbi:hypothetical protein GCM10009743_47240 [Kribbella swartbergensis]